MHMLSSFKTHNYLAIHMQILHAIKWISCNMGYNADDISITSCKILFNPWDGDVFINSTPIEERRGDYYGKYDKL